MKSSKRFRGDIGENIAEEELKRKGYKILHKNFRSKIGEIDIIAKDGDCLVFVEVKTRWSKRYGKPEEAVTKFKLRKIKRNAQYYIKLYPEQTKKHRIDVVSINFEKNNNFKIKIINVI